MFRTKDETKKSIAKTTGKHVKLAPGDDFASLRSQADRAFKRAAKAAVSENDALGIPTHGAERGKLVIRTPLKRGKAATA